MNDEAQLIKAALDRRFARATAPPCPQGAWHITETQPATISRPRNRPRGFAYAAALLGVVAVGGVAAQAASSGRLHDMAFMGMFSSSKPLARIIHKADQLSIAEAQRRMPFSIVEPVGLPARSQFLYAHVLSEQPAPRVVLDYQAHISGTYYRIAVTESTIAYVPPVPHVKAGLGPHFTFRALGHGAKPAHMIDATPHHLDLAVRRWKHGALFMDLFAPELPRGVADRIVRANTM